MPFAGHFHVHDEGSPLDGAGNRNQLTYEAVQKGQSHMGCTNHGRLGTALDHIDACRHPEKYDNPLDPSQKRGKDETLIPILGMEAYWRPDRHMDLTNEKLYGKNGHNWAQHLCLHARDLNGWRTLMRLSSKAWVKREFGGGHHGKPCIDWEMIEEDHEGIVVSTACMSSPVSQLILAGHEDDALAWCKDMIEIVGFDNFFFEVMPHDLEEQRVINIAKINMANELGRPFMATGDVHTPYLDWCREPNDQTSTHLILMMNATRQTLSKREKKKDEGEDVYGDNVDTIYLSSDDELREMFEEYHPDMSEDLVDQALDNTVEFSRRFRSYVIGKTTKLPRVTETENEAEDLIREWCEEGFERIKKQYPKDHWKQWPMKEYRERFEMEFDVLKRKGVLDYFVLVGDMVRWAKSTKPLPELDNHGDIFYPKGKKKPIRVGLGRGSAAGCLISYLIGITAIDPISWKLLFERFLNPDRVGLPDIDLDFASSGRGLVKEYLARKYGSDHVADIIAYQTFAPRAVIKAVADTQDIDYNEIKKVTESIGDTERGLEKIVNEGNELVAKFKEKYPFVWKHCLRLEDQIKGTSKHAGGVLVTPKPVNWYMPTQLGTDEKSVVTAWSDRADFPIVSDYGFVKIDVLGVNGLEKQQLTVDLIKKYYGKTIEPNELAALHNPYHAEQEVIDAFVHGMTAGVFQFGGRGITQLLRKIKPTNAIDIAVANALYRPGPIKIAFQYGDRKNGKIPESEWYWSPAVEPLLKDTLGLIAFQEQVMEIVKILGNFSGGESDSMRKAISKLYRLPGDKAREFMEQWRSKWMEGCVKNGVPEDDATIIWEAILEFAGYGFNKSHSASYALQAYQDMWLKIHYPLAFYAALLTVEKKAKRAEQEDFLRGVLREARILGVEALPPDVNRSDRGWTIDEDKIRYGLVSITDMGGAAYEQLVEHRDFDSFEDFMERIPSNFGVNNAVALAKAGAFDELIDRAEILGQIRQFPETTQKFNIKMGCGCKKAKTVKVKDIDELEDAVEDALSKIYCDKHKNNVLAEIKEVSPYFTVIEYAKKKGKMPDSDEEIITPSESELLDWEAEVLNVPLSQGNVMLKLHDFIDNRVYDEAEFDEVPAKPRRKGKAHGTYCQCEDCAASEVMVGGEVIAVKVITTKQKQEKMAFVDVAFGVNQYSCTFFPYQYKQFSDLLSRSTAVLIAGHKDDRGSVIVYDAVDALEVWQEVTGEELQAKADKIVAKRGGPKLRVVAGGKHGRVVGKKRSKTTKIKIKKKAVA